MNHSTRLLSCAALLCAAAAAPAQDAAAGKAAFARCAGCHSVAGNNGVGPGLQGVLGRKVGSVAGFRYSPAMQAAGKVWDAAALDAFIASPQQALPGNAMPFPGVPDAKVRADILAYLGTLK
jgi:cytochrome c